MTESITLRSHLSGSLNDIVESANLGALGKCSLVCELVSLFADYQEEGASLFLEAFLTNNLDNLTAVIPDSKTLKLGSAKLDEAGMQKAVKRSAPLARGCWKMYLVASGNDVEFGLFRDSAHPLNVPLNLALQTGGVGEAKFIQITRIAQDSVKVASHIGKVKIVHFTNERDGVEDSTESLLKLCKAICSGLDPKLAQTTETYIISLLSSALRASHGALIAVLASKKIPKFLNDCTILDPPINLSGAVEAVLTSPSALPQLAALENLVMGVFCCDGIVIFDTNANVIAYSAFIKLKASNVSGGARRRAFQALSDRVGTSMKATFFQSHDGASELIT